MRWLDGPGRNATNEHGCITSLILVIVAGNFRF
jgi:hypothetical protein